MSEKPFWEGKTCKEMANLHVKVTFVTGAVLTGITDCSGHIRRSRNGSVVPISANRGAERFVPYRDIESIELCWMTPSTSVSMIFTMFARAIFSSRRTAIDSPLPLSMMMAKQTAPLQS